MRAHQLKMNPTKSFLEFQVASSWDSFSHQKEFILTQTRSKLFRVCIHLRISKSSGVCKVGWPISEDSSQIFRVIVNHSLGLWKRVSFKWDKACQEAFKDIKRYLTKPPVLVAPASGKSFLLYIKAMDHSLGTLLVQKNGDDHEQTIYYLSRTLIGSESRYNPVDKEWSALVFAIQKTRHYLVSQTIHITSRVNPLRILMTKPGSLNSRLAKWAILLSQYDMFFVPQRATKG